MERFANPARFAALARRLNLPLFAAGAVLLAYGLGAGLFLSLPDAVQGETVRIMYIHVPAAWIALQGYLGLAAAGAALLVWRHPLGGVALRAAAPVGAVFAAVCLVTGALWGRPTWGAYWVWDARLTSMLLLFFLYLGVIALAGAYDDRVRGERAAAVLAIAGTVNLPVIKYSVEWWNTLHQGPSLTLTGSHIAPAMLWPLLASALGFTLLYAAVVLVRMRALLAEAKRHARARRTAMAVA